ncbi:MAG: response regulator [Chloroflexaceae bacterium]|nr:response regulator [Chloroflexaceae bacterium]
MTIRVMVVDDEMVICQLLSYQLGGAGYEVSWVNSGREAMKHLLIDQPDLVLLDVVMPDMSGWDVCRQIRNASAVPIIMLTGKCADEDVIAGLSAGADDYITKPFKLPELLARIEAVLRRTLNKRPTASHHKGSSREQAIPYARNPTALHPSQWLPTPALPPAALLPTIPSTAPAATLPTAIPMPFPEAENDNPMAPLPPAQPAAPTTGKSNLGHMLLAARHQRGLTLYQAEHACGIRWEFLQALEREQFGYIPREELRSALKAYAALLGIDLQKVLPAARTPAASSTPQRQTHDLNLVLLLLIAIAAAVIVVLLLI